MTIEPVYKVSEIVGFIVVTTTGEVLGPLTDVLPSGGNDIFVVGSGALEILVPALKTVVLDIDRELKKIVVDLPKGLREEPVDVSGR